MSVMKTCECGRENYRVYQRNLNYSYFESPRGQAHFSNYSGIVCLKCGWKFRSKCDWVLECKNLSEEEEKKLDELLYGK